MKKKLLKSLSVIYVGGLLMSASFSYAYAYNAEKTHRLLSEGAVNLYNWSFPGVSLTEQEKQWIIQGSVDEDSPSTRAAYHFYDPINSQGLRSFVSSKQWAHDGAAQKLDRFQTGGGVGIFTWEEAVAAYQGGEKERAYKTLGHIFHLVQDATVPARVRPAAGSIFNGVFNEADSYERAAEGAAVPAIQDLAPIQYASLDEYFDSVARYTNEHFLSKGSMGYYQRPEFASVDGGYVFALDDDGTEYRVARIRGNSRLVLSGLIEYDFSDPLVARDLWSRLAPLAIEADAGILKLFHDTVGKQDTLNQVSVGEGIFISVFRALANGAQAVTLRAQEFLAFIGVSVSPGATFGEYGNSLVYFGATASKIEPQIIAQVQQAQQQFSQRVMAAVASPVRSSSQTKQQSYPAQDKPAIPAVLSAQNSGYKTPVVLQEQKASANNNIHRVSRVIDGDTIVFADGEHMRYIGVDAPEVAGGSVAGECFGAEAKKRNEYFVLNQDVRVEPGPGARDAYGRMLGYIWLGDLFVNKKLIEEGYVRSFNFGHPHAQDAHFDAAQKQAKDAKIGLWAQCADDMKQEEPEITAGEVQDKNNEPAPVSAPANTQLVINEARIAGGEFVEFYNPASVATSLDGYFFAYYSSGRLSWDDPWRSKAFPLDAVIPARGYYTVAFGDFGGAHDWRAYTGDLLSNSAGTFALWKGDPKAPGSARIDSVGWGDAGLFEGSSVAPSSFTAASIIRWPSGADTNNNSQDFRTTKTMTPGGGNIFEQETPAAPAPPSGNAQSEQQGGTAQNQSSSPTPAPVVISEIQVSDAEFVELYNISGGAVSLNGHYFAYYSSTKIAWNDPLRLQKFPDGAVISASGYYLIGLKDYPTSGGNSSSDWQPYSSAQLSNSSGTVAVFPFDPSTKTSQQAQEGVIDAVGWGQPSLFEGAAAAAPIASQSIARSVSHTDTNNNAQDFSASALPTPKQNTALAQEDTTAADAAVDDSDTSSADEDSTLPSPLHIIINEVQTGDSEFVELYNQTGEPVSLNGYYFAYYSSSKTSWAEPWRSKLLPSDAAIFANGYYLIGLKDYPAIGGNPSSDWQSYPSAQLAASAGTVAIFSQDPACAGQTPCAVTPIDAVAWGDISSTLKETAPAPAPASGKSISRSEAHGDSDNNALDFVQLDAPSPFNSSAP